MGSGSLVLNLASTESLKDFASIAFSFVATIIAVLTYFHARKTLFQPVRSEVIKKQTELLTSMLESLFQKPVEASADYQKIVTLNTFFILDECGFILQDHEKMLESTKTIYGGDKIYANKDGILEEYVVVQTFGRKDLTEEEMKKAKKKKYDDFMAGSLNINRIRLTKDFQSYISLLETYIDNPFLPAQISHILEKLVQEINFNIDEGIRKILQQFALDLRDHKKQVGTGVTVPIESTGLYNSFNHVRVDHRPRCAELRQAIRKYLRIDEKW